MKKILAILSMLIIFCAGCGDTSTAVDDVKKDAAAKVQETAGEVKDVAEKVEQKAAAIKNDGQTRISAEKFSIGGIFPGMTLEEVKNLLGEPAARHDDDEFIFSNGLVVEIEKHGDTVKEIQTHQAGVATGGGVEVGMNEQNLIEAYGAADFIENHGGKVEHKYHSADGLFKIVFEVRDGIISEIEAELND